MRAIEISLCVVFTFGCAEAAPEPAEPEAVAPTAEAPPPTTSQPTAPVSAAPSAEKPSAPEACKLWDDRAEWPKEERWRYRWATLREKATVLGLDGGERAAVEKSFPKGTSFRALTTQGPVTLTLDKVTETELKTMEGPEKVPVLLLTGDVKRAGSPALFLPAVCVQGEPNLRPLKPEPNASVAAALKQAGKTLDLKLDAKTTTVVRAALPNGAAFVVNQYVAPKAGYPSSIAFTMKADGTVVDVLLKGETPTHTRSFPYAVDLNGDGVDELVQIQDIWEGGDSVYLVGWSGGKPRSAFIDSADEQKPPKEK